ncbi:MAG: protein kinase [Caldithrix sp.]|nr:protein kinase [Caldithrix sp.]
MRSSYIGKLIDNYRILDNIGRGGMGLVFRAHNVRLDKIVALKMIAPGLALNESFLKRFQTEARTLARLENRNIVQIHDLREENDQWFIVMEYVEGITLTDKIRKEGPLHWKEAIVIFKQMMNAIGHAHSAGIIHRDIKPANVLINPEGVIKVTDFGLAKDHQGTTHTQTMASGGTLMYMSPEQVRGLNFTDLRSDIYALGITLYEMVVGRIPIDADQSDFDLREEIIRRRFPDPREANPQIPEELDEIICRAIQKKPEHRYQSVTDLQNAISKFEQNQSALPEKKESKYREIIENEHPVQDDTPPSPIDVPKEDSPSAQTELNEKSKSWTVPIIFSVLIVSIIAILYQLMPGNRNNPEDILPKNANIFLDTNPPDAAIHLNGRLIGHSPIEAYAILPGTYNLSIQKADFRTMDSLVAIDSAGRYDLHFALKPEVNEPPADLANKNFRENKKDNSTKLTKSDKEEITAPISEQPRTNETQPTGAIVINTNPQNVEIWLDGEHYVKQSANFRLDDIATGIHELEIKHSGYESFKKTIELKENQDYTLSHALKRQVGKLAVRAIPWGNIYVDGELQKEETNRRHTFDLPVGSHQIRVMHPSYGEISRTAEVQEGQTREVVINFKNMVPLSVTTFDESNQPVFGATIVVDGKELPDKTPKQIRLPIGDYTIAVRKKGYEMLNGPKNVNLGNTEKETERFILRREKK